MLLKALWAASHSARPRADSGRSVAYSSPDHFEPKIDACPTGRNSLYRLPWKLQQYILDVYTALISTTMNTAKVFLSGNSQAVRLPKQFRLKSKEVEIFRRGEEIVLREKKKSMTRAFELLAELPDFDLSDRADDPPQKRKGL
jgi:antitoxin VapB